MNPDESFLKKVQNNHLELKLWENNNEEGEKFVASTRIPLHQFYIAFRDKAMIEHLSSNQLPIISFDTFANFVSPLSNANFCQGKILLAIGTHTQIEHLKTVRGFKSLSSNLQKVSSHETSTSNVVMKNKLAAFLESLSQKKVESEESSSSQELKSPPLQLKKTSDLLESLQQALLQPPKSNVLVEEKKDDIKMNQKEIESESSTSSNLLEKRVKILVSIEHAVHLPKVTKKRKNRRSNKNNISLTEFEPSSYATFDTFDSDTEPLKADKKYLPECVIRSHEGLVYSTKVIKSVDPEWNETFDIQLPLDIIRSPQKRFVVKIWRKCTQECELKPAPFEDAVIGFTAVDLSVLLTGLSVLSGYYNITDFSGRCNGQVKLSFKPLENLVDFQCSSPTTSSLFDPLNIDVTMNNDSSLLSRTLKRKFNELDEITQRLKARLFDVTGNEDFDVDEEFERDLNTEVKDDDGNLIDFEWLKKDSEENMNFPIQASCSNNAVDNSSIPTQRMLTGCSNDNSPIKDQLLWKKYDLDTLINPNIFKNILDPSICQSESTPSLNQQIKKVSSTDNSQATTVSSIDSNEMIIEALQQTFISSSERKTGDGGFENK